MLDFLTLCSLPDGQKGQHRVTRVTYLLWLPAVTVSQANNGPLIGQMLSDTSRNMKVNYLWPFGAVTASWKKKM